MICERNIHCLPLTNAPTEDQLTTQACALTGNQTSDLLLCGMTPNQMSCTGQCPRALFNSSGGPVLVWVSSPLFFSKQGERVSRLSISPFPTCQGRKGQGEDLNHMTGANLGEEMVS